MTDAQVIGTLVIASSSIISLFSMVYKPLSENTKAMTTLGVKMEHLAEKIENEHHYTNIVSGCLYIVYSRHQNVRSYKNCP